MACYTCGSDYCNGNCNNNGGYLIVLFVLCFPYIPFSVFFYEVFSNISGGLNLAKWAGAALGGYLGYKVWMDWFPRFSDKYFTNFFLYWILVYFISSGLFFILAKMFSSNIVVIKIVALLSNITAWALQAS